MHEGALKKKRKETKKKKKKGGGEGGRRGKGLTNDFHQKKKFRLTYTKSRFHVLFSFSGFFFPFFSLSLLRYI